MYETQGPMISFDVVELAAHRRMDAKGR